MEKLRQIWNMIKDKIKIGDIDEMNAQIEFAARVGDMETMAQIGKKLNILRACLRTMRFLKNLMRQVIWKV